MIRIPVAWVLPTIDHEVLPPSPDAALARQQDSQWARMKWTALRRSLSPRSATKFLTESGSEPFPFPNTRNPQSANFPAAT